MRGGKITQHSGAAAGIGGTQFQKGQFVGKQKIEDSLDPKQPPMEMTFFGSSVDRTNPVQKMVTDNLTSEETGSGSPKRNNSPKAQGSPQRLVIATQTSATVSGNLRNKNNSILGENLGFNVDLQKLTKIQPNTSDRESPVESQKIVSLDQAEKQAASSKFYLVRHPKLVEQQQVGQQATSSPYFQAFLQQNVATAQRSYSVDSFQPEVQTKHDQHDIFVEGGPLAPRPVHTQSVEVGIDSMGTPIAHSSGSDLNSSQNIHHISPILHIQQVDGSMIGTSESSPSKDKQTSNRASQKSIAYHIGNTKSIKNSNLKSKHAKVQIFDLGGINETNMLRNESHVQNVQNMKIPVIGTQIGTRVIVQPRKQPPGLNKKIQDTQNMLAVKLQPGYQQSKGMSHTASQASFTPLNRNERIDGQVRSPVPTLLDCTSPQSPRKDSQFEQHHENTPVKTENQQTGMDPAEHQATFGLNFGNSQSPPLPVKQESKHTISNKTTQNQNQSLRSIQKSSEANKSSGQQVYHLGQQRQHVNKDRLSSSLMCVVDPENFNMNINGDQNGPQTIEQIGQLPLAELNDQSQELAIQEDQHLNSMSSCSSDSEEANGTAKVSPSRLRELQHGKPTQAKLVDAPVRNDATTPVQESVRDSHKQIISPLKVQLHRLNPDGTQVIQNTDFQDQTLVMAKDGTLIAMTSNSNYPESLLQSSNHQIISQMAQHKPMEIIQPEELPSQQSADSVNRALDQIESFDFSKQLELQRLYNSHSPHPRDYNQSPLAQLVSTPQDKMRNRQHRLRKKGQKPEPREVLQLATVNIMTGAVTLDGQKQTKVPSPKTGTEVLPSPPPVTQNPSQGPTAARRESFEEQNTKNEQSTIITEPPLKPPPKKDPNFMMRTVFIEKQAFGAQGMLDSIRDVRVNYRDTSLMFKPKGPMMRTTLAMKDEASSDTVSTEFNYLQPAVRRLELNHRASIQTSSQGGVIHVLENNVASECTSDARKDSMGMNPIEPQSPSAGLIQDIASKLDNDSQLRNLYMDHNSQILFDAPAKPLKSKQQQQHKTQIDVTQQRVSPNEQKMTRQQFQPSKLSGNAGKKDRTSQSPKQASSPKQKAISRLSVSVDMRGQQNDSEQKNNTDLTGYLIQNEPNTVVLVKKAKLNIEPKTLTRDSTLKDPDNIQRQNSIKGALDEVKQLVTEQSTATIAKQVLIGESDEMYEATEDKNLNRSMDKDSSSQLIQQMDSMNVIDMDLQMQPRTLSPTKIVVGHKSNMSSEIGRESSSMHRKAKETYQFQPKELKVFDMPNLQKKKSSDELVTRSGPSSPRLFRKDISNPSIRQMQHSHSKKVLAHNSSQRNTHMSHNKSPSRMKKTIDIADERLKMPNMLVTARSNTDIEEYHELHDKNDTHQSFVTARQSNIVNEKDSIRGEGKADSKMSRFMPVLFNSEFSKTYADLLRNVAPLERKSEQTDSDYTLYPVLGDSKRQKIESIRIQSKALRSEEQFTLGIVAEPPPPPDTPMNTELRFFMEVLDRMKHNHKHVVQDENSKDIRKQYRKFLGQEDKSKKGIFGDIERKKIIKPSITLSNEDKLIPDLYKLKTERNLYLQYNLAAMEARGTEKLSYEMKKVSPLNRFKTKLKVQKLRNKTIEAIAEQDSPTSSPKARNRSKQVGLSAADTMMFKSLISSQEFSLGRLEEESQQLGSPDRAIQHSQTMISPDRQSPLAHNNSSINELKSVLPAQRAKIRAKLSQSMDLSTNQQSVVHWKDPKDLRNSTQMGALNHKINVMPLNMQQQQMIGGKDQMLNSVQALTTKARGPNELGQSYLSFMKNQQLSPTLVNQNLRYSSNSVQTKKAFAPGKGKSALINVQSWQQDSQLQKQPEQRDSVLVTDSREEKNVSMAAMSIDPAANPLQPSAKLAQQRSCFADVLSFKGERPKLTNRVGKNGHNPFLDEIEERLRNPEQRSLSLAKSFAIRQKDSSIEDKWHQYQTKPKVNKDKTIKISLKDIYSSIRGQKSIPPVPLHRMDKITRRLAESLIEETAAERAKMSEWKKQEVMLPILNTVHRNITLHTSEDLQTTDIMRQRVILKKQGSEQVSRAKQQRKQASQNKMDQTKEDQATQRAASQLSMISISLSTPDASSRQAMSPLPKSTFNNQMLRKATEMTSYEEKGPLNIIKRASRQNFNFPTTTQ